MLVPELTFRDRSQGRANAYGFMLMSVILISGGGPLPSYAGMAEPVAGDTNQESAKPSPGSSAQSTASQRYSEALNALDKGELLVAQRLFEQVIGLDPDGAKAAEARHHLAQLYSQPKSPDALGEAPPPAALPDLRQAAPTDPSSQEAPVKASRWNARYQSLDEEFSGEIGDRVFFSQASAELGTRAVAILEAQAAWLKQQPRVNVSIEGYADEPSLSAEQNQALSEARAVAVRDRMIAEGLAPERLTILARGREGRISTCGEPQCQLQNRRAVTVLVPKSRAVKQLQREGASGSTKPTSATQ